MTTLTQFASTESSGNIFAAVGIDWKMLILQIISFAILVWLLGKYVYPWLMKSVDERQDAIEAGTRAAEEAKKKAENAEKEVEKLMTQARSDAKDIVATAKDEATAAISSAESKANVRAEKIVENAQEQIAKDVIMAKKALQNETIDLVALATETILKQKIDSTADKNLVANAVKEAK